MLENTKVSDSDKEKTLNDFQSYNENPTIAEGVMERSVLLKGGLITLVDGDGVERIVQELDKREARFVDTLQYIKVFTKEIPTITSLSVPANKVLGYIMSKLKPKKDEITIYIPDCIEFCGYKGKAIIYKALIELLDKKLIYRKTGTGVYFINVNAFYNGSRI